MVVCDLGKPCPECDLELRVRFLCNIEECHAAVGARTDEGKTHFRDGFRGGIDPASNLDPTFADFKTRGVKLLLTSAVC